MCQSSLESAGELWQQPECDVVDLAFDSLHLSVCLAQVLWQVLQAVPTVRPGDLKLARPVAGTFLPLSPQDQGKAIGLGGGTGRVFTIRLALGEKAEMSGLVANSTWEVGSNPREKKKTREAHSSPGPAAAKKLSLLTGWGLSWERSQLTFQPDLSPLEVSPMGQS